LALRREDRLVRRSKRGTFGVLELPALEWRVVRASDGAEVEIGCRTF
jgi:hypothetical protein